MGVALAGQAEQAAHRLASVTQLASWGDENEAGASDALLAVLPPEPCSQWQGFLVVQRGGEAGHHTAGLLQAPRADQRQFVEVLGSDAQPDQVLVEQQRLRRATLQQLQQVFGLLRRAQCRAHFAVTQRTGE